LRSANDGWAVGTGGTILHYTQGIWAQVSSPTHANLNGVTFTPDGVGWAVGDGGVILRCRNNGWSRDITSPTQSNLRSVSPAGWAVGDGATILQLTPQGNWTIVRPAAAISVSLRGIYFPTPDEGWAVGDQGTILHYQPGEGWQMVTSPDAGTTML